mmetsp:Transcript_7222/g.22775  ORF Transcript_7222/g.22775 Transcript_7222/m.22775 type:complete len:232 (+) Transcript_7222:331-1026(+)
MHACSTAGAWPRANGAMPENDATAAATRDGFAFIIVASWRSPPSRSRAPRTWSEPPMPQRYTDPSTRGYTSRWQPLLSSAQKSAHGSSATAASPLKTTDDEYTPSSGTWRPVASPSQSSKSTDHTPMAQTTASQGTVAAPSTLTPTHASSSISRPRAAPTTSFAPLASKSFLQSSAGTTCAVPGSMSLAPVSSASSHAGESGVLGNDDAFSRGGHSLNPSSPVTDNVLILR